MDKKQVKIRIDHLIDTDQISKETFDKLNVLSNKVYNLLYFGDSYAELLKDCGEVNAAIDKYALEFQELYDDCLEQDFYLDSACRFCEDQEPAFERDFYLEEHKDDLAALCCDHARNDFIDHVEQDFWNCWIECDGVDFLKSWLNEDTYDYLFR